MSASNVDHFQLWTISGNFCEAYSFNFFLFLRAAPEQFKKVLLGRLNLI